MVIPEHHRALVVPLEVWRGEENKERNRMLFVVMFAIDGVGILIFRVAVSEDFFFPHPQLFDFARLRGLEGLGLCVARPAEFAGFFCDKEVDAGGRPGAAEEEGGAGHRGAVFEEV